MKALSDALSYAMAYLGGFPRDTDNDEDDDCNALESIAHFLNTATPEEIESLEEAARRGAVGAETAEPPNHALAAAYRDVMDHFKDA